MDLGSRRWKRRSDDFIFEILYRSSLSRMRVAGLRHGGPHLAGLTPDAACGWHAADVGFIDMVIYRM